MQRRQGFIILAVLLLFLFLARGPHAISWLGRAATHTATPAIAVTPPSRPSEEEHSIPTSPKGALFINEFMAENDTTLPDPQGTGYPDWIELFNAGANPINLQGLYLTDDFSQPTFFQITQTLIISPQSHLLLFADNDPNQGSNHLGLKLDAIGESLAIFDSDGRSLIDGYSFGQQRPDVSEGRCPDGTATWMFFTQPTPGAANGPCIPLTPPIISRLSYTPTLPRASEAVTVSAVITDDGSVASALLAYRVDRGDFVTVTMDTSGEETYSAIIPPQSDKSLIEYYIVARDREGSQSVVPSAAPTITLDYISGFDVPAVVINELMADNRSTLADPDEVDEYPDWIELYNAGDSDVDVGGLYLSDDPTNLTRFRIPSGTIVPSHGHLLFYADEDTKQGPRHLSFKLDAQGETVMLVITGTMQVEVDRITFGPQRTDISIGRTFDGAEEWQDFRCATPGAANVVRNDCRGQILLPLVSR